MLFQAFGERRSDGQMKFPAALLIITCTNRKEGDVTCRRRVCAFFFCLFVCFYIRQAGELLHLVHASGDSLRISDITLERVDLHTETWEVGSGSSSSHLLRQNADLDLVSDLVSGLTADLFGCLLQNIQLPEA